MAARGKQSGSAWAAVLVLLLGACTEDRRTDETITDTRPAQQTPAANGDAPGIGAQPRAAPGDRVLGERVRSALTRQPGLKALSIDVNAASGAVTLYGTANSPAQRELAEQLALGVEGVRSVTNHLIILKDT